MDDHGGTARPTAPKAHEPTTQRDHGGHRSPERPRRTTAAAPDGPRPHPRTISWVGASALALGGSNQSIFLIGALLLAQGTMAVPLLAVGLLLSYMATPGWIELSCMFPNRVGGIAATCAEAFRPYSAVLANLTGVCYWWGWVPTCGLTAILSAEAIHQWYLPARVGQAHGRPHRASLFTAVNLCGLRWAVRVAKPIALVAFVLALCSGLVPVFTGHVTGTGPSTSSSTSPSAGAFGHLTSVMAGLYLIGFAAPAFEAAACHIGEMRNAATNSPGPCGSAAAMACLFFVLLPVVWLGVLGPAARGEPRRRTRPHLRPALRQPGQGRGRRVRRSSTCSAARSSRCRGLPAPFPSCPRTGSCPGPSASAAPAPTRRWSPSWSPRRCRSPSC